jgi:hypothetical protein
VVGVGGEDRAGEVAAVEDDVGEVEVVALAVANLDGRRVERASVRRRALDAAKRRPLVR